MSNIIYFSSFNESNFIEEKICKIKKELEKDSLSQKKLHCIQEEILKLSESLNKEMHQQAGITDKLVCQFLSQQTELSSLIYTCQSLFVDKQVDKITLTAQKLACDGSCSYKNLAKKITKIEKTIDHLHHKEALSLENRQMINLAKKFLQAAENHTSIEAIEKNTKKIRLNFQEENAKKDLTDTSETSLLLFEIAGNLYEYNIKQAFADLHSLPMHDLEILKTLCLKASISFDILKQPENTEKWKKSVYLLIQILIGYSHELTSGFFEKLSFKEIDSLFEDLKVILDEEKSANF